MRWMKWFGVAAGLVLIGSAFFEWVVIRSKGIVVTGVDSAGTNFGKPAYFNFILTAVFIILSLMPKIWAKRWNLAVVALNTAWAIRNYFILTSCRGGDCPEKQIAIYVMLIASLVMVAASLFPDIKLEGRRGDPQS